MIKGLNSGNRMGVVDSWMRSSSRLEDSNLWGGFRWQHSSFGRGRRGRRGRGRGFGGCHGGGGGGGGAFAVVVVLVLVLD